MKDFLVLTCFRLKCYEHCIQHMKSCEFFSREEFMYVGSKVHNEAVVCCRGRRRRLLSIFRENCQPNTLVKFLVIHLNKLERT